MEDTLKTCNLKSINTCNSDFRAAAAPRFRDGGIITDIAHDLVVLASAPLAFLSLPPWYKVQVPGADQDMSYSQYSRY